MATGIDDLYPPNTCDGMADYLDSLARDEHTAEDIKLFVNQTNAEAWGFTPFEKLHAPTPAKMKRKEENLPGPSMDMYLSEDVSMSKVLKQIEILEIEIIHLKDIVQRLRG